VVEVSRSLKLAKVAPLGDQTHSLGAPFELWVNLFNTGSTTQIGKGSVIISAANDVDDLRKGIIGKGFAASEGRKFDELIVKPTLHGVPLDPETDLAKVEFERNVNGKLQAYVDVPSRPGNDFKNFGFLWVPRSHSMVLRECSAKP